MVYFRNVCTLILAIPLGLHAEIYKCVNSGKTLFSDQPCGDSQQTVTIGVISAIQGMGQDDIEQSGKNTQKVLIQDKINRLGLKIKALRQKMEREIAYLRHKKRYSMNNHAGAAWEESISTEMGAVISKYKVQIELKQEEIKQLRAELKDITV